MRSLPALALLILSLAACGSEDGSDAPADDPVAAGLLTTSYPVTVLDDGDGAELCLGGIAASLPPQCGGPPLIGWDWAAHAGAFEEARGVRWGEFVVTGTFDGTSMTPTEVVAAADAEPWPSDDETARFTTPCPEPDGGWPSLAGEDRAFRAAARLEGYAGAWWDRAAGVVNVRVVGDPAAAEAALREVWPGALCVTTAEHTERELRATQRELGETPGFLTSGVVDQQVELGVVHDDGELQQRLDERYGAGLVLVTSALRPLG